MLVQRTDQMVWTFRHILSLIMFPIFFFGHNRRIDLSSYIVCQKVVGLRVSSFSYASVRMSGILSGFISIAGRSAAGVNPHGFIFSILLRVLLRVLILLRVLYFDSRDCCECGGEAGSNGFITMQHKNHSSRRPFWSHRP